MNNDLLRKKVDKRTLTRIIVTTDGECDDQNSLRHMALYFNDFDIAGIIYSSSQFHWQGDGVHTLAEITPHFRCLGFVDGDKPGEFTVYRPQELDVAAGNGWIEDMLRNEYAEDYKFLVQNDPNYPSPEDLLAVTKIGNVLFEGDVRCDTEGSELIVKCLLDDDMRPLYLQAWGGLNTIARALLSIHRDYRGTPEWDTIYKKVIAKAHIQGFPQDNSWEDNNIAELYPDLIHVTGGMGGIGLAYFCALDDGRGAPELVRKYYKAPWLLENIKRGHGKLMANYHLMNDGTYYYGEPDDMQYGQINVIDWSRGDPNSRFKPAYIETNDFLAEGDSGAWVALVPVGLRGLENPYYTTWGGHIGERVGMPAFSFSMIPGERPKSPYAPAYNFNTGEMASLGGGRWTEDFMEDWAARNDWTVNTPENCNHPPVITIKNKDISAVAGSIVIAESSVYDPDGDHMSLVWSVYGEASRYSGACTDLRVVHDNRAVTEFRIPKDAKPGDFFTLLLVVEDDAAAPLTRYAEVVVTVIER
jgi:hypothetical protein